MACRYPASPSSIFAFSQVCQVSCWGGDVGIHVFVDNSNILGGAQRCASDKEPHVPWKAIRVYFRNLFGLLERGRERTSGLVAGSVPPGSEDLWEYARKFGYNTDLLRKIQSDEGRLSEQGVDELICLKMANAILDNQAPQVMVIATGDGRVSDFGVGFVEQLERALRRGWGVEVYSWQGQTSERLRGLRSRYPRQAIVLDLDPYYESLTFVKGGDYQLRACEGSSVSVCERIVQPLGDLSCIPTVEPLPSEPM